MSYLEPILEATRERLEKLRRRAAADLEREASSASPVRDFLGAVGAPGMTLVAEVKRRSPSAGDIRPDADPAKIAAAYREGGAGAISVLTEPAFFKGSVDDLRRAREASGLPALRKDFVVHHYQVLESRAEGADAVLLIMAAIEDPSLLSDLAAAAGELGMAALVEVHGEPELEKAVSAGARLIGVNQRNLHTFEVDRGLAARLRHLIPGDVTAVAESGIGSRADVEALERAGIDGILVGEALMRSEDPAAAAAALLGR